MFLYLKQLGGRDHILLSIQSLSAGPVTQTTNVTAIYCFIANTNVILKFQDKKNKTKNMLVFVFNRFAHH